MIAGAHVDGHLEPGEGIGGEPVLLDPTVIGHITGDDDKIGLVGRALDIGEHRLEGSVRVVAKPTFGFMTGFEEVCVGQLDDSHHVVVGAVVGMAVGHDGHLGTTVGRDGRRQLALSATGCGTEEVIRVTRRRRRRRRGG